MSEDKPIEMLERTTPEDPAPLRSWSNVIETDFFATSVRHENGATRSSTTGRVAGRPTVFLIRTAADIEQARPLLLHAVATTDPGLLVTRSHTLRFLAHRIMFKENLAARGSVLFAMLALLIALAGVYAIVAYGVARRRREIGIRLALGAAHDGVVYGVVRRAMRLAFIGLVLGTLAALALSRLIGGFLFGVSPGDPLSFSTAFALLAAVSLAASWIPVRRATRVDAVEVLRSD